MVLYYYLTSGCMWLRVWENTSTDFKRELQPSLDDSLFSIRKTVASSAGMDIRMYALGVSLMCNTIDIQCYVLLLFI